MKKIIYGSLFLINSIYASDNLVTIIETNSLMKFSKNTISSFVDKNDSRNIHEAYINKNFKNYSPYYYTDMANTNDNSPTIITMIGEKSIQYGSIYSKGFGNKYNINTLSTYIKNNEFSKAIDSLDKFNNNLVYIKSSLNGIDKSDFKSFESYLNSNLNKNKKETYMTKLNYIYNILDYTNDIYSITTNNFGISPLNSNIIDIKNILNSTSSANNSYELNGNILTRNCNAPVYNGKHLSYYKKQLGSIDVKNPISLNDLYVFKYNSCPYIIKKRKIGYPSMPSSSEQKQKMIAEMKTSRNGNSSYFYTVKNLFNILKDDSKYNLSNLNNYGITNGKILHINYGLSESISNDHFIQGIVKNVSVASIFQNNINLLNTESFEYNIDNPPSSLLDKTNTYSELSSSDVSGNNFNTLYYVINQKLESNVPEIDNFHLYSNLIPNNSKSNEVVKSLYGSEVLWLSNKDGSFVNDFHYNNPDELLINSTSDEDDITEPSKVIDFMKDYSRSTIDIIDNSKQYYPLNLKGIVMDYIPKNTNTDSSKYFGPLFSAKVHFDTFNQKIITKEPLDCTKEVCTLEQKEMINPTKDVEKIETKNYCGISFDNPDTTNYQYFVFQTIYNRVIEEPFGDIQYHKYKPFEEEKVEIYESDTKVPSVIQYLGEVQNEDECILKANMKESSSIQSELISKSLIDFDFNDTDLDQDTYGNKSDSLTAMIDTVLLNKTLVTKSLTLDKQIFTDSIDYQSSNQDTFVKYFIQQKSFGSNQYGLVNEIETIIKP